MSNKNTKLLFRILFVTIAAVLLLKTAVTTLKETVVIEEKEAKIYEVSQEKIISSGKEIIVNSFENGINGVRWISSTELLIDGTIVDTQGQFLFDMTANELVKYKGENKAIAKDYGSYSLIKKIPDYGDLCMHETNIGLLTDDNKFKVISENSFYEGDFRYVLSDDLSKLAFYDYSQNKVQTYSFKKGKYRTINENMSDLTIENFKESINLSPQGGYISVEDQDEVFGDSTFSIYGADSGNSYLKEVMGVELSWSPDESKVSFYYTKDTDKLHNSYSDGIDVMSRRVGYYDMKNKSIEYIDSLASEKTVISKIYWSSDSKKISYLMGDKDQGGNIVIDAALEYDFSNNSFNEITFELPELVPVGAEVDLINYDEEYILVIDSEVSYKIKRILKSNAEITEFKDLAMIKVNDREPAYYFKDGDSLITANNDLITLTKPNYQGFIHLMDNEYVIYPSTDLEYLAIWFKTTNEIKILSVE